MQTEYKETLFYEYEVGDIVTCYASWSNGETSMPKIFPNLPWANNGEGSSRDRSKIEAQRMNLEITNKFNTKIKIDGVDTWGDQYTCFVHWSNNPLVLTDSRVHFFLTNGGQMHREKLCLNPGARGAPRNPYQISNLYSTKTWQPATEFNKDASSPYLEYSLDKNILCNERRLRKIRKKQVERGEASAYADDGSWPYERTQQQQAHYQDWFYLMVEPNSVTQKMINAPNSYFKMNRWTFVLQTRGCLIRWIKDTVNKLNAKKSDNLFGANGYVTLGVQRDDCNSPSDDGKYRMRPSWDKSIEFLYDEKPYLPFPERPKLLGFFPFTALKADSKDALNNGQHTNNTSANVFQVVCKAFPVDTKFNEKVPIPARTWVLTWNENYLKKGLGPQNNHYQGIDLHFIDQGDKNAKGQALDAYGDVVYSIENDFYQYQTSGRDRVFLDSRNTALRESWFNAIVKIPEAYYNKLWNKQTTYRQYGFPTVPDYIGFDLLHDIDSYDVSNGFHMSYPGVTYHVSFGIVHKNVDVEIMLPEGSVYKRIFIPMTYISPRWPNNIDSFVANKRQMPPDLWAMVFKSILMRRHCAEWDPVHGRLSLFMDLCARGDIWNRWLDNLEEENNSIYYNCRHAMKTLNEPFGSAPWQSNDEEALIQRLYTGPFPILKEIMEPWVLRMNPKEIGLTNIMNKSVSNKNDKPHWLNDLIAEDNDRKEAYLYRLNACWPKNPSIEQNLIVTNMRLLHINSLMDVHTFNLMEKYINAIQWSNPGEWRIQLNLSLKEFENTNDVASLFLIEQKPSENKYIVH